MRVTRHVHCPKCRITYEAQFETVSGDVKARCDYCGASAQADTPKRHERPRPFPDDTPHAHKSRIGGY